MVLPHAPITTADNSQRFALTRPITAEQLLNGRHDQWTHLDDDVLSVLSWLQDRLANEKITPQITQARQGNLLVRAEVEDYITRILLQYLASANSVSPNDRDVLVSLVVNEIVGLGPIEPLWADPAISEVMVNGAGTVYVERNGVNQPVPGCRFRDDDHVVSVANIVFHAINRRLDPANPLEDGRLPDGSRVNATHRTVSPRGSTITIRRFRDRIWTLPEFVADDQMPADMAVDLAKYVTARCSILVAGGTGSGKTTLLNALSCCIPREERLITIEDSLELQFHPDAHVLSMEGRPPGASGGGEITIRRLVKNALRQRPDRIVVGEVRDAAAFDMLQAMNTGHEGSMTTVHANRPAAVASRLKAMVSTGGEIPTSEVLNLITDAIDLIVYVRRLNTGRRVVESISEVTTTNDATLQLNVLWQRDPDTGEATQRNEPTPALVAIKGLDLVDLSMTDVERLSQLPTNEVPYS